MPGEPRISGILLESLRSLLEILDTRGVSYAVMGGIASQVWGRPRSTRDLDILVLLPDGSEQGFLELMRQSGLLFQYLRDLGSVRLLRFLKEDSRTGLSTEVDFFPAITEYQITVLKRAIQLETSLFRIRVASPEDLILQKLASGRIIDLYDAEEIWKEQRESLDREYLNHWGKRLGLSEPLGRLLSQKGFL